MLQQGFLFISIMIILMMAHVFGQDLSVTVTPTRTQFNDKQDVEVILNYKNKGSKKILVYKWYFPDQELSDPLFEMTRDGKHVEYIGPHVKRRAPTAEDMVSLEPGKDMSTRVQLSFVYNMTATGNYAVRFNVSIGSMLSTSARLLKTEASSSDARSHVNLVSPPATLFVVGRSNALIEESVNVASQPRSTTYTYSDCSLNQKSTIIAAIKSATSYASSTVQYLSSVRSPGTTRYTTWFGTYSFNNFITLGIHFTRISNVLNTESMFFNCDCTENDTYAYVYVDIPYKIYLCPLFWSSSTTGTDTRGGTLIHEISHFTIIAGTVDHEYGQADCKSFPCRHFFFYTAG